MARHEALSLLDLIYEGKYRPDRHAKLLESETLPPEPPDDTRPGTVAAWRKMVELQDLYRSERGAKRQQAAVRFRDAVAGYRSARELGFTAPQLIYAGIGGNIQMLMRLCAKLGYPERSIVHCEALKAEWREWNDEHGFGYRVHAGIPHNSDRARLADGEEAEEEAPAPPYLELLA